MKSIFHLDNPMASLGALIFAVAGFVKYAYPKYGAAADGVMAVAGALGLHAASASSDTLGK